MSGSQHSLRGGEQGSRGRWKGLALMWAHYQPLLHSFPKCSNFQPYLPSHGSSSAQASLSSHLDNIDHSVFFWSPIRPPTDLYLDTQTVILYYTYWFTHLSLVDTRDLASGDLALNFLISPKHTNTYNESGTSYPPPKVWNQWICEWKDRSVMAMHSHSMYVGAIKSYLIINQVECSIL